MEVISHSATETQRFGQRLAASLAPGDIICLYGELGSGKTTFVQGLAKGLGVTRIPISPTFIFIREYPTARKNIKKLYHVDLYRVERRGDIGKLGLSEIMEEEGTVIVIEWAEKAGNLLPGKRIDMIFECGKENTRIIKMPASIGRYLLTNWETGKLGGKNIKKAISIVRGGGVVIFPTDTAFGIGCRIDNRKAVDRLFAIRQRPRTQATPVLVSSQEMALQYLNTPPDIVRRLMEKYWPGGLTIVAKCRKDLVYAPIRGGRDTIGIRMPNHNLILAVIQAVGLPILGPSANFHGEPTPYNQKDLNPELVRLVDYLLPGKCTLKQVSTVVDCSVDPWRIIRQGAVDI